MHEPEFKAITAVKRHPGNPVLSAKDVPYPADLVFNAGVARYEGRYVMVFRNDFNCSLQRHREFLAQGQLMPWKEYGRNTGLAFSDDGIRWKVSDAPLDFFNNEAIKRDIWDPRISTIDGRCYLCLAVNSRFGQSVGIVSTTDFRRFTTEHISLPHNRNGVLLPEKVGGQYILLSRPMVGEKGWNMWISSSPDGVHWGNHKVLLSHADVCFCNTKIGPAAPPIKTPKGWLTLFHAVYDYQDREFANWRDEHWKSQYMVGVMLLDLDDPSKIVGRCKAPIMVPEKECPYEIDGYRGHVIFPGGMIQQDSGEVRIYYGASDTVECLATADVGELIRLCR